MASCVFVWNCVVTVACVISVLTCVDRQRAPVCSVLGKTYWNECLLHKEACRKRRRTGLAHAGPCLGKDVKHVHTISTQSK